MKNSLPSKGLYAITQTEGKSPATVVSDVEAAIRGGAVIIQYRDKNPIDAKALAEKLMQVCRFYEVPFIVNDHLDLAVAVAADGVHLGKDDGQIAYARQCLGADAIIGVSCYNSIDRALDAQHQGASYVAFGRFFPSSSKPLAAPASIETLRQAKPLLNIPIVAIGGILPENGAQLLSAGADLLAVIGGVFDHDPELGACAYQALFVSGEVNGKNSPKISN